MRTGDRNLIIWLSWLAIIAVVLTSTGVMADSEIDRPSSTEDTRCLTMQEMEYFLETTGLIATFAGPLMTLHPKAGPVLWVWNGRYWCRGGRDA